MREGGSDREDAQGTVNEGVRAGYWIDRTVPVRPSLRTNTLTPAARSERISRIHGKNTKPELKVRRLVQGLGYRYRLHRENLPGKPDRVFSKRRKIIFVHGCFWHRYARPSPTTCRPHRTSS